MAKPIVGRTERGVALITVILVLLVLTVLGITASVLMTQEDRTSSRQQQDRAAFYAAEAGLRKAEQILGSVQISQISGLLQGPTTPATLAVTPNNPQPPIWGNLGTWTAAYLGCYLVDTGGTTQANQALPINVASGAFGSQYLYYSVYVRNNPTDPCGGVTCDGDYTVQVMSAGWVASQDGTPLAVKILEEQYGFSNPGGIGTTLQKELNAGATSSAQFIQTGS